jgi:hypothetical protein
MQHNVAQYKPSEDNFTLEVLLEWHSEIEADLEEERMIEEFNAKSSAHGYNQLPGTPASWKQFWYLHRLQIKKAKASQFYLKTIT